MTVFEVITRLPVSSARGTETRASREPPWMEAERKRLVIDETSSKTAVPAPCFWSVPSPLRRRVSVLFAATLAATVAAALARAARGAIVFALSHFCMRYCWTRKRSVSERRLVKTATSHRLSPPWRNAVPTELMLRSLKKLAAWAVLVPRATSSRCQPGLG